MSQVPRILYVARDDGGCGFFRCQQPAKFLKRMGFADTEVTLSKATEAQLLWADLVIMQEMGSINSADIVRFLIEHNIPYLAEFDDFIHHVSPHNVSGHGAWNPSTLFTYRAMDLARRAYGIQVSTNQLAREYFPYNPTTYVIPNYFDKDLWTNPISRHQDDKIRIGWAGGNAHADDLFMISNVLEKVVKESNGQVIFETMGMTDAELRGVFKLSSIKENCPSCGYEGEIHHYLGESLEQYPLVMASKGWDIAVAPVINNSFGNCKSDNKIKEYAASGVPIIASPVVPYLESEKEGAKLLFADTFGEWYTHIKDLISDATKRDDIARSNREWVARYWIQDHAKEIFEVYSEIIAKAYAVFGPRTDRPQ